MSESKERHGCVNAWLWLIIIANLCMVIYNVAAMFGAYTNSMSLGFGLVSILAVVNILGGILLMRWNKCGFYLYTVSALLSAVVSITVLDATLYVIASSLFGILIWWGILHIKKNGITAWRLMKGGWDYKHCRHLYQVFGMIMGILLIMTIIVCIRSDNGSPYESISYDNTPVDTLAVDQKVSSEVIEWSQFSDDRNFCSIEAPSDFRKTDFCEGQILSLICSDYDPAIVVVQESVSSVMDAGIKKSKDYANAIVKIKRNDEGASNFKKISEEQYHDNSYLVVYVISMGEYTYRYNILATKTKSNFYYCQVYCLESYVDNLQPIISHMLGSFKAKK